VAWHREWNSMARAANFAVTSLLRGGSPAVLVGYALCVSNDVMIIGMLLHSLWRSRWGY